MPPEQNMMSPEPKTNGALLGSIIIIIILIVGGIYLWQVSTKENTLPANSDLGNSETSDTTANLEADVNSIELEDLDEGI